MKPISIRNISKKTGKVHELIYDLASEDQSNPPESEKRFAEVQSIILQEIMSIEDSAKKRGGTPADLTNQSLGAYQWLRFLGNPSWLNIHVRALSDFLRIARENITQKGLLKQQGIMCIRLTHSNNLFKSKRQGRQFNIEINECFITAPLGLKEKIISASMGSSRKTDLRKIRIYAKSEEFRSISKELKSVNQPNRLTTVGNFHDLKTLYASINKRYFNDALKQPRLVWSVRKSRRRLGTYDPDSNTITINRILDNGETPRIALESILFHEMLHQKLGIQEVNGRRYAHTTRFKRLESQFVGKEKAEKAINSLLQV